MRPPLPNDDPASIIQGGLFRGEEARSALALGTEIFKWKRPDFFISPRVASVSLM
jgi:hypothetical protein